MGRGAHGQRMVAQAGAARDTSNGVQKKRGEPRSSWANQSRRSSDGRVLDETFGLTNTDTVSMIEPTRLKSMRSKRDLTGWSLPCSHATVGRLKRSKSREIHPRSPL